MDMELVDHFGTDVPAGVAGEVPEDGGYQVLLSVLVRQSITLLSVATEDSQILITDTDLAAMAAMAVITDGTPGAGVRTLS